MLTETLREVAGRSLRDEDGAEQVLELRPAATEEEISQAEEALGLPLPAELRDALRFTTGFANGPLESLDFLDLYGFGMEDVFPHAFPLGHDGFGNYWVLDLIPGEDAAGPVFFACHDPPVIAFQSANPSDFIRDVVALWEGGPRSPVDRVHEDITNEIWRARSGLLTWDTASASDDDALRTFAKESSPETIFADLRSPVLGDGFPWGHLGPRTEWRRAGTLRIWGAAPPPRRPGLLSRLLGRKPR